MTTKKLKYQELLSQFPNCPPEDYKEVQMEAFRWVHSTDHANDFLPVNLLKEPPPRYLDDEDKMCTAYGLSLFDNLENACARYKAVYKRKREHLRDDVGECMQVFNYLIPMDYQVHQTNRGTSHFTNMKM